MEEGKSLSATYLHLLNPLNVEKFRFGGFGVFMED